MSRNYPAPLFVNSQTDKANQLWYSYTMLTHEEIRAVYDQGPEAVIALIKPLCAQIAALTARVKELKDRLATKSRNSSKPPSSDSFTKQTRSLRQPSGRKTGGQPGHPGTTLQQVAVPDQTLVHAPEQCGACGASLADVVGQPDPERRQVFDLPPLKLEVTEHRVVLKTCARCGHRHRGTFPAGVACGASYGAGVKGVLTSLNQAHLLPSERRCQMVADVFGSRSRRERSRPPSTCVPRNWRRPTPASNRVWPVRKWPTLMRPGCMSRAKESGCTRLPRCS